MEDAKPNQQRAPRIELPPPLAPKPVGGAPNRQDPKDDSGGQAFNEKKPPPSVPALPPAKVEKIAVEGNSRKTRDQLPALEAAGDGTPADAISKQKNERPAPSEGTSAGWVFAAVLIIVAVIVIASQSSAPQNLSLAQRSPVDVNVSTEPTAAHIPNGVTQPELRVPSSATPASRPSHYVNPPGPPVIPAAQLAPSIQDNVNQSQKRAPATQAAAPTIQEYVNQSQRRAPSSTSPSSPTGRNYVWRGKSYAIPSNQMQRFNAIKRAGVPKLAAMKKLADQIENIEWQMEKADKNTKSRLAQQRDALSAQLSQVTAEYSHSVSEMDQLLSSIVNP